jgi:catechol 2,3-dioxygenase-like lactoylglutathione lyase family enzyme
MTQPYQFSGIDHVQLAAPPGCEPEARAFFGGLLGWPELSKPAALAGRGGAWFQCGTHQVHIGVEQPFMPARKAHPAFRVRNLDQLRAHLARNNVHVTLDEARSEEGVHRLFADDPFGNRLEFIEEAIEG